MYYVYILQSKLDKSFYVGSTNDISRRIKEHNSGKSRFTSLKKPWLLVYFEGFLSKTDALKREKKLKHHGKGLAELKKRFASGLLKD
jgi:putative endonuclease